MNNTDDGIDLDENVDIVIADNIIANNGDDGIEIRLHAYSGPTLYYVIERNEIYENGEDGIQLIDYPDSSHRIFTIRRNLIYNNDMAGIGCMSDGNTIENYEGAAVPELIYLFNNTIDNNDYALTGGANLVAVNNLFTNSLTRSVKNVALNSIISYSLFTEQDQDNSNIDANTIYGDPQYIDNFELGAGSPAVEQGTSLFIWKSDTVLMLDPSEFVGLAPDIGAKESSLVTALGKGGLGQNSIIYPNPSNGSFVVDIKLIRTGITLEIIKSNGSRVLSKKLNQRKNYIKIPRDNSNIYYLRLLGKKFNEVHKIVIY